MGLKRPSPERMGIQCQYLEERVVIRWKTENQSLKRWFDSVKREKISFYSLHSEGSGYTYQLVSLTVIEKNNLKLAQIIQRIQRLMELEELVGFKAGWPTGSKILCHFLSPQCCPQKWFLPKAGSNFLLEVVGPSVFTDHIQQTAFLWLDYPWTHP